VIDKKYDDSYRDACNCHDRQNLPAPLGLPGRFYLSQRREILDFLLTIRFGGDEWRAVKLAEPICIGKN
jgi:hypothetical protein